MRGINRLPGWCVDRGPRQSRQRVQIATLWGVLPAVCGVIGGVRQYGRPGQIVGAVSLLAQVATVDPCSLPATEILAPSQAHRGLSVVRRLAGTYLATSSADALRASLWGSGSLGPVPVGHTAVTLHQNLLHFAHITQVQP